MQQVQVFTVSADEEGQRLDNYLVTRLKGVPKSAVYRVIRKGEVRVNKGRAKPERRLVQGDLVRVPPLRMAEIVPPPAPGRSLINHLQEAVLYDKDGLLIVDKPAGLAVHGGSGVNLGLIEALRQMPGHHGFLELVHRLDKETSGCVMIARKRSVLKLFQEALRQRSGIKKTYLALAQGRWPKGLSEVGVPLKRFVQQSGDRIVRVSTEGKASLTRFQVVESYRDATLLRASPITGRTHQIRVHAQHSGCPLVGDEKYGDTPLNQTLKELGCRRLFLHAISLEIKLEAWEPLFIEAAVPSDLRHFLLQLPKTRD